MKRVIPGLLVGAALFFIASLATAQQVVFQTASARLTVESSGIVSSLTDKQSGQEELRPAGQPIATVTAGGRIFPASSFKCSGSLCQVGFGASGISADYRITSAWTPPARLPTAPISRCSNPAFPLHRRLPAKRCQDPSSAKSRLPIPSTC